MSDAAPEQEPWGYRWRSSTTFIVICIGIALFTESFLFGFVTPLLPYILKVRNHVDPPDIQRVTYQILTSYGVLAIIFSLFVGQLADLFSTRKTPLLLGLGIAFIGTLTLAASTHLWGVYLGRFLQSFGGVTAWIVGQATLRDSISGKDMGKAFGVVYSFVSLGGLSGPAAAGILLEIAGYWATWIVSLLVISTDIVMRLLMLEQPTKSKTETGVDRPHGESDTTPDDSSPLLPEDGRQSYDTIISKPVGRKTGVSVLTFYKLMLGRKRVLVALACNTMYSAMIASYSTTIPVHVMAVFGWGSLPTGLLFVGLQGPIILFGPLFGWLRDKVGTRLPAGSGFLLLAPLIWLLGAAAEPRFPWAHTSSSAKHTYIGAIIGIGCVTNLMSGVGAIEITSAVDELESDQPGIFGTKGGYSRSFSLTNVSFVSGLVVGPLLSGILVDSVGYYYMNCTLACICVLMSIVAFSLLSGKSALKRYDRAE